MTTLYLATCAALPELSSDCRRILPFAQKAFDHVDIKVWNDPDVDWSQADVVVIRSCWDYYQNQQAFLSWTEHVRHEGARLFNPPEIVRWNSDKHYLDDLRELGCHVPETAWIPQDVTMDDLHTTLDQHGWDEVVYKPAISANAFQTWRGNKSSVEKDMEKLNRISPQVAMMAQPFFSEIQTIGELSLIYFQNTFGHALIKNPQHGDFRVQELYGGSESPHSASSEQIDQGLQVLEALQKLFPQTPYHYARVDGVLHQGAFYLMELELIEPGLFFELGEQSPKLFVDSLCSLMERT